MSRAGSQNTDNGRPKSASGMKKDLNVARALENRAKRRMCPTNKKERERETGRERESARKRGHSNEKFAGKKVTEGEKGRDSDRDDSSIFRVDSRFNYES